jgi:hypothetical protein
LKAQTPAKGILIVDDWGDAKNYHIVCGCRQPDHSHDLWIEADETGVNVNLYLTAKSPFWSTNRFKQIWTLLTKGYLEQETTICMSEQQAINYARALTSAVEDVKLYRNKRKTEPTQ